MVSAAVALLVANSSLAPFYFDLLHTNLAGLDVLHWINDGLMAVFFLYVSLELKRELLIGQLSTWNSRLLPGVAALGGMIIPAAIYVGINLPPPPTLRGWAIPAATDIAFALGVMALLGKRVPQSLKLFLTALAILDDLGAILIIALFYTAQISVPDLAAAGAACAILVFLNWRRTNAIWLYLLVGAALWYFVLRSGLHATLAGVVIGLAVPVQAEGSEGENRSPLRRLEHALAPWTAYLVVPIFGFANAGVSVLGLDVGSVTHMVPMGISVGLVIGKPLGVFLFSTAAIKLGLAKLPSGATWLQFFGTAAFCGIGFTMSLFIGNLAFTDLALQPLTKLGVLLGSIASALFGLGLFAIASRHRQPDAVV